MNVYEFINSKSISKYLAEINYKFNAIEAAYLVWQCKNASLSEKFAAWREIIETMPDMSVKARRWGWICDEPSVHVFLYKYMQFVQEDLNEFYKTEEAVYTFSVLYRGDTEWSNDGRIFSSPTLCERELKKELEEEEYVLYEIKKTAPNRDKYSKCTFLKNGEVYEVYVRDPDDSNNEKAEYAVRFEGLWFAFPTPFKRGDIVYQPSIYEREPDPLVLIDMCTWGEKELRENGYTDEKEIARRDRLIKMHEKDGDNTDMGAGGYYIDEHGRMYRDHTYFGTYLDMEYYDGELLKGQKRFLTVLSQYEKGKIDIALLANAYKIYNDTLRGEHIKKYAYFTDDDIKRTGLRQ